jgi:ferredoxin
MKLKRHVWEALVHTARQPCIRHNCGTVCKCGPCHARIAMVTLNDKKEQQLKKKYAAT